MSTAAFFMGGARGRLLPLSIPFRFFACAAVFQLLMWAALFAAAEDIPAFAGGPGLPLATLHMLTLGVLTSTAMGAAFQLLPVATRRPLGAVWPSRLAFWLFVPGIILLYAGMALSEQILLLAGGVLTVAGLVPFAMLLADNLRRARDLPMVAAHGWVAFLALIGLAIFGLLLILDFEMGFLGDHGAVARAHLILAGYGFMGMFVLGFSLLLVPMFGLAPSPSKKWSRATFLLSTLAIAIAVVGTLAANMIVTLIGGVIGLGAASAHLGTMALAMKKRMRKKLGLSFVLIRVAWGMLPLSILVGLLDLFDLLGPQGGLLFGFLLLFGWLLTFLLGILQRIMPFLASMHGSKRGGKPPLVSELSAGRALPIHACCHIAALPLFMVGLLFESGIVLQLATAFGVVGGLAFVWFTFRVLMRTVSGG